MALHSQVAATGFKGTAALVLDVVLPTPVLDLPGAASLGLDAGTSTEHATPVQTPVDLTLQLPLLLLNQCLNQIQMHRCGHHVQRVKFPLLHPLLRPRMLTLQVTSG